MSFHLGLPSPEPLDLRGGNFSENLKKFKQKYKNYEIATGINMEESATRVAACKQSFATMLLMFLTLWHGIQKVMTKKSTKYRRNSRNTVNQGKMSVTRDTSSFQAAQKSGETIDQYVSVLRKLSETCGFSTLKNSLIKDRIVLGICDTKTTERLLIWDLTLEKAIDKVRSAEATEIQQRDMANDPVVHGIGVAKKKPPFRKEPPANEYRPSSSKIFNYRNRGTRHGVRECPTYGKTCHNCKKQHYFQSICWSQKNVHGLMADKEEENDCEPPLFVGAVITEVQIQNDECYVTLPVQGHLMRQKVDTGSQVNIMLLKEL